MNFLKKIISALMGIILYPIKSILINIALVLFFLIAALVIIFCLPGFVALGLVAVIANDFFTGFLIGFFTVFASPIIFLAASLIAAPVLVGLLLVHTVASFFSFFKSIGLGAMDGYKHGFSFVGKKFIRGISLFSFSAAAIKWVFNHQPPEEEDEEYVENEEDEEYEAFEQEEDVPVEPHQLPADFYQESLPQKFPFIPLTSKQIEQAKGGSEKLRDLVSRYEDLFNRLDSLDQALKNKTNLPDDECAVFMEMEKASLCVKEYWNGSQWRVVPASTKIVDFETYLEPELKRSGKHPTMGESITDPSLFKGNQTRYKCYSYNNINDAQELREVAEEIEQELNLKPQPSAVSSSSRNSFFSEFPPANDPAAGKSSNCSIM